MQSAEQQLAAEAGLAVERQPEDRDEERRDAEAPGAPDDPLHPARRRDGWRCGDRSGAVDTRSGYRLGSPRFMGWSRGKPVRVRRGRATVTRERHPRDGDVGHWGDPGRLRGRVRTGEPGDLRPTRT